jgi:hypothetical protein
VTGLNLTRGPGLAQGNLTNGFSANNWSNVTDDMIPAVDRSVAIANGDFFQFGFTLDGSHTASLSGLDLALRRSAQVQAPSNFEVQVSLDNFATPGIPVSQFTYKGASSGNPPEPNPTLADPFHYLTNVLAGRPDTVFSPGDAIPTIDLTSIEELQDVPAGTTVTFRLYGWNNGETNAANSNTVAFRIEGPRITGFVEPSGGGGAVPEPGAALMASLFAVCFGASRRRSR